MLTGGCFCGYIRYEAGGTPFHETICHCTICRRSTGGACVAWFSVPKAEFRVLSGHPAVFNSTEHGTRSFCPQCGTQLTFEDTAYPEEVDVTTTSLDEPEHVGKVPPKDHTHVATRLSWLHLDDELPQFPEARDRE
jgi:hypothetical protein